MVGYYKLASVTATQMGAFFILIKGSALEEQKLSGISCDKPDHSKDVVYHTGSLSTSGATDAFVLTFFPIYFISFGKKIDIKNAAAQQMITTMGSI